MKKLMFLLTICLFVSINNSQAEELAPEKIVSSLNNLNLKKIATCEATNSPVQQLTFYAQKAVEDINNGESVQLIAVADLHRKTSSTNMNVSFNTYTAKFNDNNTDKNFAFADSDDFSGVLNWEAHADSTLVASPRNHQIQYTCTSSSFYTDL